MKIFSESERVKLVQSVKSIEDNLDDLEQIDIEAKHISDLIEEDEEIIKQRIRGLRFMEKREKQRTKKSSSMFRFIILTSICGLDPLIALALSGLLSDPEPSTPAG